jgi:peptide/nickel transport system substrate-binding protein
MTNKAGAAMLPAAVCGEKPAIDPVVGRTNRGKAMHRSLWCWTIGFAALLAATPAIAAETAPKRGGTLVYLIPADAPPTFDGHRETTFATGHTGSPFYSVLIRINPDNPGSTADFVCDLCTEMAQPADGGKTYTFKIRQGVKFHDGSPLTAADVAASLNKLAFPPQGVLSPRSSQFEMVDRIESTDPETVVIRLKFATSAFLPVLADPFNWIYKKAILDKDIHWYEKNIMGSGPFKFAAFETGQAIKGVRNPDYYLEDRPYLDAIHGIYAPKQATRIDALRSDRAAIEFRGMPPASRDELKKDLGDRLTVQESDWNCGNVVTMNHARKPFDDVRVRRALSLAIDRWKGAEALSKIANVRTTGSIVFPNHPLSPSTEQLYEIAGFWRDINKSRAEAKRLLKEAGAENLQFELLTRDVDQPYKYTGIWLIDEWSKVGVKVTQRVMASGPYIAAQRAGDFTVVNGANCHSIVNPLVDVHPYLSSSISKQNYGNYEDPKQDELLRLAMHETDPAKQKQLMFQFTKHVMDTEAHKLMILWWYRIVPHRSYVKGWKISPSHYLNQDLANVWLDR